MLKQLKHIYFEVLQDKIALQKKKTSEKITASSV